MGEGEGTGSLASQDFLFVRVCVSVDTLPNLIMIPLFYPSADQLSRPIYHISPNIELNSEAPEVKIPFEF